MHIREVVGGGVCLSGAHEREVASQQAMAAVLEQARTQIACGALKHALVHLVATASAGPAVLRACILSALVKRCPMAWARIERSACCRYRGPQGSRCRATASTGMNQRSSRSHAIFSITVEQRRSVQAQQRGADGDSGDDDEDEAVDDYLCAKMHLVDFGRPRMGRSAFAARICQMPAPMHVLLFLALAAPVVVASTPENRRLASNPIHVEQELSMISGGL